MKRYLLLALALAALLPPSVTIACNCQATRAQRWLAYKAYKEKMAAQRERLLAEHEHENQRKMQASRKATRKGASARKRVQYSMQPTGK